MIFLNKIFTTVLVVTLIILVSDQTIAQKFYRISIDFEQSPVPPLPDYSSEKSWCALPMMKDMADSIPRKSGLSDDQLLAKADVFFIHPTIYTGEPSNKYIWNADIRDGALNSKIDQSTILNQSTAFNGSCKVYAPRYRQAHYSAFTTENKDNAKKSLALAYEDIRSAFQYYLDHYNDGRPIVIASHSQGTVHAETLIKEYFDGKPLQSLLVQAYLVGMDIKEDVFENIEASNSPENVGGFVTWNTFHTGYYPSYYENGLNQAICTNPLTWKTDEIYADRHSNTGGVGLKFKFVKSPVDAQVKDGLLWIKKPHIPGRIFIKTKIWHHADINLYWMNIRENVALRVEEYFNQNTTYGE